MIPESLFVNPENSSHVATPSGEPFSLTVPPLEPDKSIYTTFSNLDIDKRYLPEQLRDVHAAHRLPIPREVTLQAFDVAQAFFAGGLVDALHRKGEMTFNGATHPLVAAAILKEQLISGVGPLLRGSDDPLGPGCNTFLWGSLFTLTVHWAPYLGKWVVATHPIIFWPHTNEESPNFSLNDYGNEIAWIREGRLFLTTF